MRYKVNGHKLENIRSFSNKYDGKEFKYISQEDYNQIILRPYMFKEPEQIDEVLSRFIKIDFQIFRKKLIFENAHTWDRFYPSDVEWLKNIGLRVLKDNKEAGINTKDIVGTNDPVKIGLVVKKWLCRDMSRENGPALSVIIVGHNAAIIAKEMFGAPIPIKAVPGTIRHDFGNSDSNPLAFSQQRSPNNVGHCGNRKEIRYDVIKEGECAIRYETRFFYPDLFRN